MSNRSPTQTSLLQDLDFGDAARLLRRTQQFHRLAERLTVIGKADAAKHGIGPLEFDAIVTTRITAVEPLRIQELTAKLLG